MQKTLTTLLLLIILSGCEAATGNGGAPQPKQVMKQRPTPSPTLVPAAVATRAPQVVSERTAISCEAEEDRTEIYLIDEIAREVVFFNQGSQAIEPLCTGNCNWTFTDSRISFENPSNGFITGAILDRIKGQMTLRFASEETPYARRDCRKISMPRIAKNKF